MLEVPILVNAGYAIPVPGYVPAVPYTNVMDVITDNEEVTAAAFTDITAKFNTLIDALVTAGVTGISESNKI